MGKFLDYSENTLPRLKRVYVKRCQEADEAKGIAPRSYIPTSPTISAPVPLAPNTGVPNRPPSAQGNTVPRGRQSSIGASQRPRSPSNTGAPSLSELAHQGNLLLVIPSVWN